MAINWKVALPLHPEYRTLPMVWYVPPLSPIQTAVEAGHVGMNGEIPDLKSLRIPLRYLANLLTAGDEKLVERALERLIAMRAYKRSQQVDKVEDLEVPTSHKAYAENAYDMKSSCGFSFGNGCGDGNNGVNLFSSKATGVRQVIPVTLEK